MNKIDKNKYIIYSISDYHNEGAVVLNQYKDGYCDGVVNYRRIDEEHVEIYELLIEEEYRDAIDPIFNEKCTDFLIKIAFQDIIEAGKIPVPNCPEARNWYQEEKERMGHKKLVSEIEPNSEDGNIIMRKDDDSGYELFIEYPVRKACKDLNDKNIDTIMSSANKEDAKRCNEPEKNGNRLFIGQSEHFSIGNGYAWIMIDYNHLTQENKDIMDALNSGETPINLNPEALKRFAHICQVNKAPMHQRELVKYFRVIFEKYRRKYSYNIDNTEEDDYFSLHYTNLYNYNSLVNHGADYRAVVLRYPIDENTTVEEIEEYYNGIIKLFKENKKIRVIGRK